MKFQQVRYLFLCVIIALFCGCAASSPSPSFGVTPEVIQHALAEHPIAPGADMALVALGKTREASFHLVQVGTREKPHIHATHDATVCVQSGIGRCYLEGKVYMLAAGSVLFIPHGQVHYAINDGGSTPLVGVALFSPPLDRPDRVSCEVPAGSP